MYIKTSDPESIKPFIKNFSLPKKDSHKGQNGRVLVIGGSSLFHSASIWAAEVASHFVDIVHYSSTKQNNEIIMSLKKQFQNGIVIDQKNIPEYVEEDDAILIGPGMIRGKINSKFEIRNSKFSNILKLKNEAEFTYYLTYYLLNNFPDKRFVIDAGALQMMDKNWLKKLKVSAIITPHQREFENLFGLDILNKSIFEKEKMIKKIAKEFNCVIILKAIDDIVSDGADSHIVSGGNQGLTKGGTGDLLAGLIVSLYGKNSPLVSCVVASYLLKKNAEGLFQRQGYWFNVTDIINNIPRLLKTLIFDKI